MTKTDHGEEMDDGSAPQLSTAERLKLKEDTVTMALHLLDKIRDASGDINETWTNAADTLRHEHNTFNYQVGVAGDTGMGKTSLLNALIGYYIAPESQLGACTSAVCRFTYNQNQEEGKFAATVVFKSKDAVDEELKCFFSNYKEASLDGDVTDEAFLRDEEERFDQYLRITSKWSGHDVEVLKRYGWQDCCKEITTQSTATRFFDLQDTDKSMNTSLTAKTPKNLLKLLRPFVSGTEADAKFWPLVECVDIYVPSELLRGGLILVDLPGELDATEARSDVAKKYYAKLDGLMVITPCDRAADNKTATDMLRDDQVLDLDVTGRIYNGMCIVSTKIDQMDWEKFVDSAMPAEAISSEFPALLEEFETIQEALTESVTGADEMQINADKLETRLLNLCIKARNREIKDALQKYFDKVRNSLRRNSDKVRTELQVFPVSSQAESRLQAGRPERCFRDSTSTGFEDLKSWLHAGMLSEREAFIERILHQCVSLFAAVEGWMDVGFGSRLGLVASRPPTSNLDAVKALLDRKKCTLKENLQKTQNNFRSFIRREEKHPSFSSEVSLCKLKERFVDKIRSLALESASRSMHAGTFAACVRRRGALFRTQRRPHRPRKTYDWQGKLQFADSLPEVRDLPEEYIEAFKQQSYRVENFEYHLRSKINSLMSKYVYALRNISSTSRDLLVRRMNDLYTDAVEQKGKGRFKKQKAAMERAAEQLRDSVFAGIGRNIDEQLRDARNAFLNGVKEANQEVQKSLATLELSIANQIYNPAPPKSTARKVKRGSRQVREQIAEVLDEWRAQWEALREKVPDLQMKFVNDEQMREIARAEESFDEGADGPDDKATVTKRRRGNKNTDSGRKRKSAKTASGAEVDGKKVRVGGSGETPESPRPVEDDNEEQQMDVVEDGDLKIVDLMEED